MLKADELKLVVFDCDGTLVDSQRTIIHCASRAFEEQGLPIPNDDQIRSIIGLSLEKAMMVLAGSNDPNIGVKLAAGYRHAFVARHEKGIEDEPLYDGVLEVLDNLLSRELFLGVATGKNMAGLLRTIDRHALKKYFVTLQTADLHPSKPHPSMLEKAMADTGAEPTETLIIGDTVFDMEMGRNAGCHTMAVAYGYHPAETLRKAGASSIAQKPLDILQLLAVT